MNGSVVGVLNGTSDGNQTVVDDDDGNFSVDDEPWLDAFKVSATLEGKFFGGEMRIFCSVISFGSRALPSPPSRPWASFATASPSQSSSGQG